MKKKIMIFMLLFSVLVGVGGAVPVKAEDDDYTFKEWCEDNGYNCAQSSNLGDTGYTFTYDSTKVYFCYDDKLYGFPETYYFFLPSDDNCLRATKGQNDSVYCYEYVYDVDGWRCTYNGWRTHPYAFVINIDIAKMQYTGSEIYNDINKSEVLYYKTALDLYTFEDWCSDAGLNCAASSNESSSVIPFFYEPDNYNYIVSKNLTSSTTSNVYNLLMIQKSDGAHYPYHFQVNDIDYLGIAGAFADISRFTVRKFNYDPDGGGWKLIKQHDISELPFDHTDFTFDENTVFLYSDTHIYADRAASFVWQPASTEYFNVDIPEPEITRVPVNPGTGSVGGQAKPGGIMAFVISTITLAWTDLFAVKVPVDGYQISFQQIFVYGALVAILWWLGSRIFGKK